MAAKYKLYYFNARGRAELARFILKHAGVEFVDERFEADQWPVVKDRLAEKLPFGQVPALELEDGTVIAQTLAIARYLARQHGLAGENNVESAKIDMMADGFEDFFYDIHSWILAKFREKNPAKAEVLKQTVLLDVIPKHLPRYERFLKNTDTGWLVGKKLSWADLLVAEWLHRLEGICDPNILKHYPKLKGHQQRVLALPNIKKWMEERPSTSA